MDDLFRIQKLCLRIVGHNIDSEMKISTLQLKLRKSLHICFAIFLCSSQIPMLHYLFYNREQMELVTATLSVVLTNLLTSVKFWTFLYFKPKFIKTMCELTDLFDKTQHSEAKLFVLVANARSKRLVKIYFVSVICTGLYFHVAPIVKITWAALMGRDIDLEMPMPMRFVFDYESTPGYQVGYCFSAINTTSVMLCAIAIDGLFFAFAMNISGHMQALQHFIKTSDFRLPQMTMRQKLSSLVQYHIRLLALADCVREIVAPIVFAQFLLTSLEVCVIIYQLFTNFTSVMVVLIYGAFLMAILSQLFIYCYGGEMIKEESLQIGIAVQLSYWYELAPTERRMLLLLLRRSQRPAVIKIGFYEASLANFMNILRTALSYITLIQSFD